MLLFYVIKRLLLLVPTFLGITLVTFIMINLAPGGPVEQKINQLRISGAEFGISGRGSDSAVTEEQIQALKKHYGFDKPLLTRYLLWLKNTSQLDFGESFTYEEPAMNIITSKFPVSLQFGLASLFLTYLICIPLGVAKAISAGSLFDKISDMFLSVAYVIPPLILGLYLIVIFAGGSHFDWFPIGSIQSDNFNELGWVAKILDRIHHFVLPLTCYVLGNFTELTTLTRNSMMDIIKADYIRTARAKGVPETRIYFKHALRNALIPIVTGLSGFFGVFLSGSIIIEALFNLDGIGLLGYKAILARDYNVIMGITFMSSIAIMLGRLLSDILYVLVDPRVDFK